MPVHATAFRNTDGAVAQEGGEKIAIIDPESFYVPKIGTRILSAIKLAKKRISLQMNGLGIGQHILLVQGTGQIIPLEIVDDILVMKILQIDARKVKVTKEMTKLLTVPKRDMFNSVVSSNKLQFLTTDLNQRLQFLEHEELPERGLQGLLCCGLGITVAQLLVRLDLLRHARDGLSDVA